MSEQQKNETGPVIPSEPYYRAMWLRNRLVDVSTRLKATCMVMRLNIEHDEPMSSLDVSAVDSIVAGSVDFLEEVNEAFGSVLDALKPEHLNRDPLLQAQARRRADTKEPTPARRSSNKRAVKKPRRKPSLASKARVL